MVGGLSGLFSMSSVTFGCQSELTTECLEYVCCYDSIDCIAAFLPA